MNTKYSQIKINLPLSVKEKLQIKANKYGVTMTFYIKYLIIKDLEQGIIVKRLKK